MNTHKKTGRKRVEEGLKESEERYREVFAGIPDGVIVHDSEGVILDANAAMARRLGIPREALLGRTLADFVTPDNGATIGLHAPNALRGLEQVFETAYVSASGQTISAEVHECRIPWKDGRAVLSVSRDITERKRAEEKIRQVTHAIVAAREEEKKRVSSVLHHDVGSLAVGLSAHLDAIEEDVRSGKTGEALKWVKRARKLFEQSVTRLRSVAVELRPPELDVLGLSAALRFHFLQVTGLGNVRIYFTDTLRNRRVSDDVATVVFRIVQESLTNAIKHGHAKKVEVRLSASKTELFLTVWNDGRGFHPAGKGREAVSHLGLRMMEEMMTSVGGSFTIDSKQGKGARVVVRLPIQRSEVRGQRSEVRGQRSEVRGQRSEVRGELDERKSERGSQEGRR